MPPSSDPQPPSSPPAAHPSADTRTASGTTDSTPGAPRIYQHQRDELRARHQRVESPGFDYPRCVTCQRPLPDDMWGSPTTCEATQLLDAWEAERDHTIDILSGDQRSAMLVATALLMLNEAEVLDEGEAELASPSAGAYAVKLVEAAKHYPEIAKSLTEVRTRAADMVKRRDALEAEPAAATTTDTPRQFTCDHWVGVKPSGQYRYHSSAPEHLWEFTFCPKCGAEVKP